MVVHISQHPRKGKVAVGGELFFKFFYASEDSFYNFISKLLFVVGFFAI